MNIPGYTIERELGHGGMSTVYLAEQESLGRKVALKVMAPALAADRSFGERFLREARTVAQLSHPNILAVYDIGAAGHSYYLAMEYVPGGDLKQRIRQGAMPPEQALEILKQVAAALGYAHEKGFVHRDVKPENILFRENGSVVLTDFGIAKAVGSGTKMTGTGMTIGTAHYMSPEQARGRTVDGRSDLYSLGVVLYEMLTGRVPYDAEDTLAIAFAHVNDPVPQLVQRLAVYQPLIDRLLAKDPAGRFVDVGELIAAVEWLQSGQPPARPTVPASRPAAPPAQKTQVMTQASPPSATNAKSAAGCGTKWALGGTLLALLLVGGIWLGQRKQAMGVPAPAPEAGAVAVAGDSKKPGNTAAKLTPQQQVNGLPVEPQCLSSLTGKNALEKSANVLEGDRLNIGVKLDKSKKIASYLDLAERAIKKNNFNAASRYLAKTRAIGCKEEVVAPLDQKLKQAQIRYAEQMNRKRIMSQWRHSTGTEALQIEEIEEQHENITQSWKRTMQKR